MLVFILLLTLNRKFGFKQTSIQLVIYGFIRQRFIKHRAFARHPNSYEQATAKKEFLGFKDVHAEKEKSVK